MFDTHVHERVVWFDSYGRRCDTLALPRDVTFPDLPGVYIMSRRQHDGTYTALYVGESESLHQRLTGGLIKHHAYVPSLIYGMTHICVVHVPGRSEVRFELETSLRRALNPIVNRQ